MPNDELEVIQEDDSDAWQCQLALEARRSETMTHPYSEDEDIAYERLRQERDDDDARLRDTLKDITRSLKTLVEGNKKTIQKKGTTNKSVVP